MPEKPRRIEVGSVEMKRAGEQNIRGLALFMEEQGFGEYWELEKKLAGLERDSQGTLVSRPVLVE